MRGHASHNMPAVSTWRSRPPAPFLRPSTKSSIPCTEQPRLAELILQGENYIAMSLFEAAQDDFATAVGETGIPG